MMTLTNEALLEERWAPISGISLLFGPGEHEGRGQSAPRKFWGNENARPEPGTLRTCMNLALGVALLLSDEGFQKTLRLQICVPNVSKGVVFAL